MQDSPILGDVWLAFANAPGGLQDLLLSPYRSRSAGPVASIVSGLIHDHRESKRAPGKAHKAGKSGARKKSAKATAVLPDDAPHVAYLQGLIAARLRFREVLQILVPMTGWWITKRIDESVLVYETDTSRGDALKNHIGAILQWAQATGPSERDAVAKKFSSFPTLDRYLLLAGLILWAGTVVKKEGQGIGDVITGLKTPQPIVDELWYLFEAIKEEIKEIAALVKADSNKDPYLWQISLNRVASPALEKSVPAVKGDAARTLFKVKCSEIAWAVIDSGIDSTHPVFRDASKQADGAQPLPNRIVKTFDFSNIRRIVSLDNRKLDPAVVDPGVQELIAGSDIPYPMAVQTLKSLANDAAKDRAIDWSLVEQFVNISNRVNNKPVSPHGTHVAGIIGADKGDNPTYADGMCPDINLYDFRVLNTGSSLADTEFAIIAALQYIRYLNDSRSFMTIHGVNLSLSIPHDVRNFACGRTPICNECERLVESGVVVVAAAGNMGYHTFETRDGSYEGYTAFSITDPGNSDSVITVGATHRSWPHTYGVSFFSSRGPTGDGRMKPDLVAPGERISSSVFDGDWKELDGTSMAAPHVSGAAAMLMARYAELVGQPRRIKALLCDTATDLGRERSFQGNGMLDVLRAFQKV